MQNKKILMLEDDKDDRYITQSILTELGFDIPIQFLSSSEELFRYLDEHPLPAMILLEYNSTPDNGIEVLKKLRRTSTIKAFL